MRRDAGPGAPLRDLAPRLANLPGAERAQPAVNGALVVEGQPAAEVGALDERDGQAALRGVVGGEQPVDAAADDEHIVAGRRQGLEGARHTVWSHL